MDLTRVDCAGHYAGLPFGASPPIPLGVAGGERPAAAGIRSGGANTENPMAKKWYAVHTYSGFENKVKKSLEERVRQHELQERFGEILIPMEVVQEMVKGEKKTSKRKVFPGYILVNMEMSLDTWHLVKGTAKVTGFVGNAKTPDQVPAVSDAEVQRQIQETLETQKIVERFAKDRAGFAEHVRISEEADGLFLKWLIRAGEPSQELDARGACIPNHGPLRGINAYLTSVTLLGRMGFSKVKLSKMRT